MFEKHTRKATIVVKTTVPYPVIQCRPYISPPKILGHWIKYIPTYSIQQFCFDRRLFLEGYLLTQSRIKIIKYCCKPPRYTGHSLEKRIVHTLMDHQNVDTPSCPFCPFSDTDARFVMEHIEFCHPENGTEHGQFTMQPQEAASEYQRPSVWDGTEYQADKYVDCPNSCGEVVANTELSTHLDLHFAEEVAHEDPTSSQLGAFAEESNGHRFDRFDDDHDVQDKYVLRTEAGKAHNSRSKTAYHETTSAEGVKKLGVRFYFICFYIYSETIFCLP